jgi:hypothetical protein
MGVSGNLRTMALPDLLQWAKVNRKSGTFELQRNGVRRCLAFRDGVIIACSSNDASLLGQYLLTASKITPQLLQSALATQRKTGQPLAKIVIENGIITEDELKEELTSRAEETIYSLFDWMDAAFQFDDNGVTDESWIDVAIDIDSVLLNGLQRLDEVKMIRNVFKSSGIVLERTQVPAPDQITNSGMASRILGSIDGRTPLSDVLEQAQSSEFLVVKFLYHLYQKKVIAICEERAVAPGVSTLVDELETAPAPDFIEPVVPSETPAALESCSLDSLAEAASMFDEAPLESDEPPVAIEVPASLMAAAADLMADAGMSLPSEPEVDVSYAIDVGYSVDEPATEECVAADAETEPEVDAPLDLSLDRVPVMLRDIGTLIDENLSAESCMLVQLIGAHMDIEMILGTAPFSEEAVLEELRELADRGIIGVRGPGEIESPGSEQPESAHIDPISV